MPLLSQYDQDGTLSLTDKVLGTDSADGTSTKNYTLQSIHDLFAGAGTIVTLDSAQTLENKTMDFSSGGNNIITLDSSDAIYDNSASTLTAVNVQDALDELDDELSAAESDITTNAANISALDSSKADKLAQESTISSSTPASSLTPNSFFEVSDGAGGLSITLSDEAAGIFSVGDYVELHVSQVTGGVSFPATGSQAVFGSDISAAGYYKLTYFATNKWSIG